GQTEPDMSITPPTHGVETCYYTSSLTVITLNNAQRPRHPATRYAWLRYLKQRQLTEELGWKPADREYGGWGYSRDQPRKPRPGELALPLIESNLSATAFALDALAAAGVPARDPLF